MAECGHARDDCLRQLDDQQVWWRPQPSQNSIANLVLHLCGNLRQRGLSLIGGEPDIRNRPLEFTERGPIAKDELLRRLDEVAAAVDTTLAGLQPLRLTEIQRIQIAGQQVEESLLGGLLRTLIHLGGHAQEIVCLTRMQLQDKHVSANVGRIPTLGRVGRRPDRRRQGTVRFRAA